MSAASLVTLSPGAFDALLPLCHAAAAAMCRPRCDAPPRSCPPIVPACLTPPPARDVADCGLLLQQALREIDLLRSGLENAADLRARRDSSIVNPSHPARDASPSETAREPGQRLAYAVRPIGEMPPRDPLRVVTAVDQVITIRMTTHLGTLIDALM